MNSDKAKYNLSSLERDATIFLWDGTLTVDFWKYTKKDLEILIKDKSFSYIKDFVAEDSENIVLTTMQDCKDTLSDILQQEDYKKRYTQQLVIGMARMEWVHENTINKIYSNAVVIDENMQKIFKDNNLTLMDLSSKDVMLWKKEKELFVYTMLFLHNGENSWELRHESDYYTVYEWWVEIKEYWIKSFEQAFNCAWQIYNELFYYNKDGRGIPHQAINCIDDIYKLYDSSTVLTYQDRKIDAHQLSWILNVTRTLLHIQAHKHLDYIRWEIHDPASFVKYKKGKKYQDIYWSQIDEVRDYEVKELRDSELAQLTILDSKWERIKSRSPWIYNADIKAWTIQNCVFNWTNTTFTWRSKGLISWIMKLINDPRFKKWKTVTDSLWNSFYVKNKEDGLRVRLWLIDQLPEHLIDGQRIEIKWDESWRTLLNYISRDWSLLPQETIIKNLSVLWISKEKILLLFRNKHFFSLLTKNLQDSIKDVYNDKTRIWYEEFKLVTKTWTEYQISEKKDEHVITQNERWSWNHGIYDFKKLMEFILRPNNNSMVLWHDIIKNIIKWALDREYGYLLNRAKVNKFITKENEKDFNPWSAIMHQLMDEDNDLIDYIDKHPNINNELNKNQDQYFGWNRIRQTNPEFDKDWNKTTPIMMLMQDWNRSFVEEYLYNLIQRQYVWYITDNKYIISKKWGNERLIKTQLEWYKLYKKLPKESSN